MSSAQSWRVVEQLPGELLPGSLPPSLIDRSIVPPHAPVSWTSQPNPPSTAAPEGPYRQSALAFLPCSWRSCRAPSMLFLTWQTENAKGKAVRPATGLPQAAVERALTCALGIPSAFAKKRETEFAGLPVSFALVVAVTV